MASSKIVLWSINYTPVTPVAQIAASPIVITSISVSVLIIRKILNSFKYIYLKQIIFLTHRNMVLHK